MTAHARFTASAAERWMNCPGSIRETAPYKRRSSKAAAEGTYAHSIAAECLIARDATRPAASLPSPKDWLGSKAKVDGHEVVCDQEMVDGIQFYLDDCAADFQPGDKVWTELGLLEALQKLHPALGGTADRVRWRAAVKHLRVADFKYGAGVLVGAEDNRQMKTYALGALLALGVPAEVVEVRVVQPRIENVEGRARSWTFWAVELLDFADELIVAIRAAEAPDAPTVPGTWCQKTFCPAAATCPALEKMRHDLVASDFKSVASPDTFDVSKISEGLNMIAPLKAKIKALEELAYSLATSGTTIPGWKLVEKRGTRKFTDPEAVVRWAQGVGVDPYEPRVVRSPAQIETAYAEAAPRGQKTKMKEAAKAALAPYTTVESSGTTLVPESDDRPSVKQLTADAFDVLPAPAVPKSALAELF